MLKGAKEVDLQTLTADKFAAICHMVLFEEHGIIYKPVAGDGGDSGIDGFVDNYNVVYQFKFFKARPRPTAFLNDIDKVAHLPNLNRWVLLMPEDPTIKLYQLLAREKAARSFDVDVLGKTWLLSKLEQYNHIKDRFFPEIAKESSVQKVIHLDKVRSKKQEQLLKELRKEIKNKRPTKISAERPSDSLTPVHIRLIKDEIKRMGKATRGRESFNKICSNLKNKYGVDNWLWINDDRYTEIMDWLRKYYYATKATYEAPGTIRNKLIGVIKSQQRTLALSDEKYRDLLFRFTGKTSSTAMEIAELELVRDQFNILLGLQK